MTLADLRTLLTRAHGAAVERLEDRTIKSIAVAYLPRWLEWTWAPGVGIDTEDHGPYPTHIMLVTMHQNGSQQADLTDPGTVNAVKVALALALGLDPGAMGCAVSWRYGAWGWVLRGTDSSYIMSATIDEQDPIRALVLACQHVIKEKA